jgi:hypothetical protein
MHLQAGRLALRASSLAREYAGLAAAWIIELCLRNANSSPFAFAGVRYSPTAPSRGLLTVAYEMRPYLHPCGVSPISDRLALLPLGMVVER